MKLLVVSNLEKFTKKFILEPQPFWLKPHGVMEEETNDSFTKACSRPQSSTTIEMEKLRSVKPFEERQLLGLYPNSLFDSNEKFISEFVDVSFEDFCVFFQSFLQYAEIWSQSLFRSN